MNVKIMDNIVHLQVPNFNVPLELGIVRDDKLWIVVILFVLFLEINVI